MHSAGWKEANTTQHCLLVTIKTTLILEIKDSLLSKEIKYKEIVCLDKKGAKSPLLGLGSAKLKSGTGLNQLATAGSKVVL